MWSNIADQTNHVDFQTSEFKTPFPQNQREGGFVEGGA